VLRRALRAGTRSGKLLPVLCGSSKEYHGVRLLLDAVRDYLPAPHDRPPVAGFVPKTKDKARADRL
jgi:elongation factor G